jgi:hypothetical protein
VISSTSPPHAEGISAPDPSKGQEVLLYPNPTSGMINIKADVAGVFYLYSMDGKMISTYKINEGITNVVLPNELATGVYTGRYVGDDGNTAQFKIVKE